MKRLFLLICISLLLGQARAEKSSGGPLRFNTDGTFKIVQFTDIHAGKDLKRNEPAVETMNMVLDEEKPNLVVYTGDIVTENNPQFLWKYITEPCRKRNIPFVITFGNHDSQFDIPRDKLYKLITELKGCLNLPKKESEEELYGYTNQVLPIFANANDKPASLIYLFDSNSMVELSGTRYLDWIHRNQVEWYKTQSCSYTRANENKPLPSLAFFHIPLSEYGEAYNNPKHKPIGRRIEDEGASSINSGLFAAFLEQGDVMGVFVGHDHDNDYVGYLHGIALGYGRHTGANYPYREMCRGARIFQLYEGKRNFDTWVRLENYRVIDWKTVHYPSSFLQQGN